MSRICAISEIRSGREARQQVILLQESISVRRPRQQHPLLKILVCGDALILANYHDRLEAINRRIRALPRGEQIPKDSFEPFPLPLLISSRFFRAIYSRFASDLRLPPVRYGSPRH